MCGIAALCGRAAAGDPGAAVMEQMLAAQCHRGPDHSGWSSLDGGRVLLGHNRLAIVGLASSGNQPLSDESGGVTAVVNGEIYNYPTLRRVLEGKGHRFSSDSDSEVVVHLYEELGEALVDELEGMFALVVHDDRRGLTLCARDRLGKKPLLYAATEGGVAVASEIPALRAVPGLDEAIDEVALGLYLLRNFRHVPDPYTLYRGIRRLPPGHAMTIVGGQVDRMWRYWHPRFDRTAEVSPEEVLAALDRAVGRRMLADVDIAALLSGGVDSTAIVDSMQRHGAGRLRTFALGRDADDDELVRARAAAAALGTLHEEHYFDPDRAHGLHVELIARHGEPIALLPLVFAYELCRQVRGHGLKVVMTGHGADEIFYGYTGFIGLARLSRVLDATPRMPGPLARAGLRTLGPGRARDALLAAAAPPGRRKAALYRDEAQRLLPELLHLERGWEPVAEAAEELFLTWFADGTPRSYIDEAAVIGLMHENAHSVTIAADLPGMAASVEVRCPFLDPELVELAFRIPFAEKVGTDDRTLKRVLKRALAERIPAEVLYAPKRGFGFNLQEADVLSGPWWDAASGAIGKMGDAGGILDGDGIRDLLDRFRDRPGSGDAALVSKLYALALSLGA